MLSAVSIHTVDCNDVILPSCVSSSLCHALILRSKWSHHWRESGVCASSYACETSLALVMHLHLLTQRTPAHYHAMVITINILLGTTCVYMLSAVFIHAVDCNDVILPSCVSLCLYHALIVRSEKGHWRESGVCASCYACGTSLALVMHLHLLTQRTPADYHTMVIIMELSIWRCIHASD